MNARLTLLQVLLPVLSRLAESPDKSLAAEAADEYAAKAREMARIKRTLATPAQQEDAGSDAAMAA